jgi:hypothetical protein
MTWSEYRFFGQYKPWDFRINFAFDQFSNKSDHYPDPAVTASAIAHHYKKVKGGSPCREVRRN